MTWTPRLHPRDPAGRFAGKGGWAGRVVDAMTGHHQARAGDTRDTADWAELDRVRKHTRGAGDAALGQIYHQQGFHGKPEMITEEEMDRRFRAGWTLTWRGVSDYDGAGGTFTGGELADRFREGDEHFPGKGIYGNGTYTTTTFDEALSYTDGSSRSMARVAISPDARVVNLADLLPEMMRESMAAAAEPRDSAGSLRWATTLDRGRLAALMGYDVIHVPLAQLTNQGGRTHGSDYYIVLNRSAVAVQEPGPDKWLI